MIGFFDSGIGGLTVVKAFLEKFPQYQTVYLGDTARVPYGNRSAELVYEFTRQGVDYLFRHGCEIIVLACNTASSQALRRIQQEYLPKHYPGRRVLGVIRPLAEAASKTTRNNKVGVIGTFGTIHSDAYARELHLQKENIQIIQSACPLLVPLVEEGWWKKVETKKILKTYLRPIKHSAVDTLILGCTHYQILLREIRGIMSRSCRVLDSAEIVSEAFGQYLKRHPDIEQKILRHNDHRFFITDFTEKFEQNVARYMGRPLRLEKISLEA